MDEPPPDPVAGRQGGVTRRRLLWLAGAGGVGAAAVTLGPKLYEPKPLSERVASSTSLSQSSIIAPPPPPVAVPPPPPPTAAASGVMLCRDAWRAEPALPGGATHTLSHMTLHHTGAVLGDNSNAPGRLRQHQQLHQGERGWIDIAYHVGVDRNGNIYELRSPDLVGDTATEYNPVGHFLVLCEGDFDQEAVTEEQLNSAALVFAWAAQQFQIATDTLAGHRDFAATSCPGADLYGHLESGDLRHRVDDLMAAGPVNLQELCGPEAAEKVAAIEAGG